MEKSPQSFLIGLSERDKTSLLRLKDTLVEGEVVNRDTYDELRDLSIRLGDDLVFNFFDLNNNYASIYLDLAKAGVYKAKDVLLELVEGCDRCEKDDFLKEVIGALGLIYLNVENSEKLLINALSKSKLKENNWHPYEIIPDLLDLDDTEKSQKVLKLILEKFPNMPERYKRMAFDQLK